MLKKFLTGVMTLICAASVHADPLPLSATININSHLDWPALNTLHLDVNNILAGAGAHRNDIESAYITVFGYSDAQYSTDIDSTDYKETGNKKRKVCFIGCWNVTDHDLTRKVDVEHSDSIVDTMGIAIGWQSAFGKVGKEQSQTGYGPAQYEFDIGGGFFSYDRYFKQERHSYDSWSGDLSAAMDLGAWALADLKLDGLLDLNIFTVAGHFDVESVRLDFVMQQQEQGGGAAADIPLPGTLLLSGLGLAALGSVRRRRK